MAQRRNVKPKSEFERTCARLLWAKKIHVGKGLIGRKSQVNTMRQLIEFYRSDQWQSVPTAFAGLSSDLLRVVNKVFPIANRQQAGIASRNPRVQYFPRRQEDHAKAPYVEALHNYDIQEQQRIVQSNAALRDAQFAPFPGILRHGYTPERELYDDTGRALQYFRAANPNRPWVRRVAPWNVLIDPRAESFEMDGGAQWCAFRSVMTIDQIKRNPSMIAREELDHFSGNISAPYADMMPEELLGREDPDRDRYVEVWTVFDLEDRTWKQLTLSGIDKWLRPPADWPIPWEWLPFNALVVNPQMDTPYPIALMQDLLPYQNELNQVRTMISLLARNTRRLGFYDTNKIDEADATLLKDAAVHEWFATKGNPSEAVFQAQFGSFPQELLLYAKEIVDDMRESCGLSLFARAQRENVSSATEAAAITEGQDVIESRIQAAFDRFSKDIEMVYMQGRRAILKATGAEEAIRIIGREGAATLADYVTIDAEKIAGEFEFELVAGSTQPRDKDREAQKAAIDLQLASSLPFARPDQNYRDYLELRGKDPARYMEEQSAQASSVQRGGQMLQSVAGAQANGAGGQGGGLDANLLGLIAAAGGGRK